MAEAHGYTLPVGARIDNYEILGILGEGGFGITYKAWDHELGCDVAIKEYLPSDLAYRDHDGQTVRPKSDNTKNDYDYGLDMFVNEAKTLAGFNEPNIVQVKRFLRVNGTAYLVMNYVEGRSLSQHLRQHEKLDEKTIKDIFVPLLKGLSVVHAKNVLHRDIKPGNIYLRDDGVPVLIDFGSAREALGSHSRSMTAIISPGYAPFEQYSSRSKPGPAMDLYAIGAAMYRCVTGHTPLEAPERVDAIHAGDDDPMESAVEAGKDSYPREFLEAIDWMMATSARDRPQSIAELLAHPGMGGEISVEPLGDEKTEIIRPVKDKTGGGGKIAAVIALLAVLGAGGWWMSGKAPEVEARKPAIDHDRLRASREAAQREEEKRRAAEAEKRRLAKLAAEKEKAEKERRDQQALDEERKRLAEEKKKAEEKRIAEEKRLKAEREKIEAERARLEKEKLEAEKRRLEAERKRLEAEKKRIAALKRAQKKPAAKKPAPVAVPRKPASGKGAGKKIVFAVYGDMSSGNTTGMTTEQTSLQMRKNFLKALRLYGSEKNIVNVSYTLAREIETDSNGSVSSKLCSQYKADIVVSAFFEFENMNAGADEEISYVYYDCDKRLRRSGNYYVSDADGAQAESFRYQKDMLKTFKAFLGDRLGPPSSAASGGKVRKLNRKVVLAVHGHYENRLDVHISTEDFSRKVQKYVEPELVRYVGKANLVPVSYRLGEKIHFEGNSASTSKKTVCAAQVRCRDRGQVVYDFRVDCCYH